MGLKETTRSKVGSTAEFFKCRAINYGQRYFVIYLYIGTWQNAGTSPLIAPFS